MDQDDKLISAAQVAKIWNERARTERDVKSNYTRWSVRGRREELGGIETELGWLYSEKKARSIPLRPRDTKRPDMVERNQNWSKKRKPGQASEDTAPSGDESKAA